MSLEDFLSAEAPQQAASATQPQQDALAPPAPPPPPGDFGAFLAKTQADDVVKRAQATSIANAHSGVTAAAAGQAAQTGRQIGVPQSVVETDPAQYQAQAKAQANAAILSSNPVLAKWVASNPDAARIAQDEYDKLSAVEKMWGGAQNATLAVLKGLGGSYNQAALAVNRLIGAPLNAIAPSAGDWWYRNMVAPKEAEASAFNLDEGAGIGQKAAQTAGSLLGMLSQITMTGGGAAAELPATAGAAQTVANAATNAGTAMAFPSLVAATNVSADTLAKTNDPAAAAKAAMAAYFFSTLQGAVPFSVAGGLGTRVASGALSSVATSEGQRAAMNLLMPQSMHQEFDPQETVFQALTGAVLGGVMGPRSDPHLYEAVRQTYADALKAEKAERDIGKVQALGAIAANSDLRKSDPNAFHDLISTITDKSDLDAVYVNGAKLAEAFAQSKFEPTPEMAKDIVGARLNGGDVRISIADYATHIAGTDLEKAVLPEMRVEPDGMTLSEGQSFFQKASEAMKTRAAEMAKEREAQNAADADKAQVQKNVLEQLAGANRNPEAVNRTYATLISEFYSAMGEREGVKATDLFNDLPLRVEGAPEPQQFGASATKDAKTAELVEMRKRQSVLTSIMECMA